MRIKGLTPAALAQLAFQRAFQPAGTQHVFIAVGDHYEPKWKRPSADVQQERVARWEREYPRWAEQVSDSRGRHPQHTFFYPQDEYDPEHAEGIARLCRRGFGDVEVHLHHDNDTSDGLREKLLSFTRDLHERHGLLRREADGRISYSFIHGNWALDNSRSDGRWCGVNDELNVLLETGCYADLTMPSAPADCQTSTMNSLYYAVDDPRRPKSHDRGTPVAVGRTAPKNSLLMIQGPLALDWSSRKFGLLPRIENGDLIANRPPTLRRFQLWLQAGVRMQGRPDWSFIKLYTHGAQEGNAGMLLGDPMLQFHRELAAYADKNRWLRYYYVTAREMAALVHQAEQGRETPDFDRLDPSRKPLAV